jgi:uncharacterized phage-like protein YoqJ
MTDKEAMAMALDALTYKKWFCLGMGKPNDPRLEAAITALKERLAQSEQEPVAWGVFEGNLHDMFFTQSEAQEMAKLKGTHAEVRPFYTTPPQRTEQNFCPRCGKRTKDLTHIHTCTPPPREGT